jgi:hypothetical protein
MPTHALTKSLPTGVPGHADDLATFPQDIRKALALLRVTGARCRVMARSDLFRACAMLSADKSRAAEAVATALIRGLTGGGGLPRLRLYQPGANEVSFDELWLLSALAAANRGDSDSLTFLLARRVPAHSRRQIGFLVMALQQALARQVEAR